MKKQFAFLAMTLLLAPGYGWAGSSNGEGGGCAYKHADGRITLIEGSSVRPEGFSSYRVTRLPDPIRAAADRLAAKAQALSDEETLAFIKGLPEMPIQVVRYNLPYSLDGLTKEELAKRIEDDHVEFKPRAILAGNGTLFLQENVIQEARSVQLEFELLQAAKPKLNFDELLRLQQQYQSQAN
jgi:hypothetical protein